MELYLRFLFITNQFGFLFWFHLYETGFSWCCSIYTYFFLHLIVPQTILCTKLVNNYSF